MDVIVRVMVGAAIAIYGVITYREYCRRQEEQARYHDQFAYRDNNNYQSRDQRSTRNDPRSSRQDERPTRNMERENDTNTRGSRSNGAHQRMDGKSYNDTCPICTEVFLEDNFVMLECKHKLHNKCAFRLVRNPGTPRCPICRKEIDYDF